ncbi:unnamed protein product [Rotaria socialis]|uniref:G-protein coupled receptors family 1 profile domain-containing protein n=1 Tax=Rotaria socialis TaxID=392032 RepID=A0A821AGK6_9BILA|nr:unnamed protein product [Rotaria socialis]CAF4460718.1 unnamed protein product [Rotaria socialis]CAF4515331.1 unnamed protein product [Rotaria socialis]CAF4577606.1 unnamed protein product [Rotaria socialis]CAF4840613.1 unnamed protein product [Rotaria socialis]
MTANNSSNSNTAVFSNSEMSLPRPIRFWLLVIFNIPSVICSFSIIIHIIMDRVQRYALQNHTILLILIIYLPIQLVDINFYLVFFHYGYVSPSKPIVCLLWWFADYGCFIGGLILMACTYVYTLSVCGASPCYQSYGILGEWEFIVNSSISIVLESIVSIGLIVRVQRQKRRIHQSTQWHKYRRMIIQLFLVSSVDLSLNLPFYLIAFAHLCGLPQEYGAQLQLYFFFLGYFAIFLFPFASLCQFPELRKTIKNKIIAVLPRQLYRRTPVGPVTVTIPMVQQQ